MLYTTSSIKRTVESRRQRTSRTDTIAAIEDTAKVKLKISYVFCRVFPSCLQYYVNTGGSNGGGGHAPLATWASAQNALKVAIFRLKIKNASSPDSS